MHDLESIFITVKLICLVSAAVCSVCFGIGLMFATGAGSYWLGLFDAFASTVGLVVIALLEMVAVIFIYGHEK